MYCGRAQMFFDIKFHDRSCNENFFTLSGINSSKEKLNPPSRDHMRAQLLKTTHNKEKVKG